MSLQPSDSASSPEPPAQKRLILGVIIGLICLGVILAILGVVYRQIGIFAPHSEQIVVLLPFVNKGAAPAIPETPLPIAAPTFFGTPENPQPPSNTAVLPSDTPANPTVATPAALIPTFSVTPTTRLQNPTQTAQPTASSTKKPSSTSSVHPTQGTPPQASKTPTRTSTAGSTTSVTIRNDQACVDSRLSLLYIFGEIVNDSSQAYDIKDFRFKVYDTAGEINTSSVTLDTPIPHSLFVFPNSSIPFVVNARISRPQPTRYELSLTTQPGQHTPRSDLRVDEYTITNFQDLINVSGKWSYTTLATPPEYVSLFAVAYDALGRVANLGYLYRNDNSAVDPQLAPGQHSFDYLTLESSPCGEGNIVVNIIGE
jgi:hypothetical protein